MTKFRDLQHIRMLISHWLIVLGELPRSPIVIPKLRSIGELAIRNAATSFIKMEGFATRNACKCFYRVIVTIDLSKRNKRR